MKTIKGTKEFQFAQDTAIAIGKFDGLHIGHQTLLTELLVQKTKGLQIAVFTFDPPPAAFFDGKGKQWQGLTTGEEKQLLFEKMGVDYVVEYPLDEETAHMEPGIFVQEVLSKQMKMRYLVAGEDVSFGYRGAGNATLLQVLSSRFQYELQLVDKIYYKDHVISSTYIRNYILEGNMELAMQLLGRAYSFSGKVIPGAKLGRTIGMPTANMEPDKHKIIPPCGVYYAVVTWRGREYQAVANVGYKPTVASENKLLIETYLFGVTEQFYGELIEVSLLHFKRPEYKFVTFEELTEAIAKDKDDTVAYFNRI